MNSARRCSGADAPAARSFCSRLRIAIAKSLAGPAQRLNSSISNNYGLSGFIVAALAGGSVVAVVVGSVFIASLLHAGITLQADGLSVFIIAAVYGLVLLGIAVGEVAARFRLVRPGDFMGRSP